MSKFLGTHYKRRTIDALLSSDKDDRELRVGSIAKPLLNLTLDNVVPDECLESQISSPET